MGKYLKLFEQHSQYEAYINSSSAVLPNVSFCEDQPEVVHYNPWVEPPFFCKLTLQDGTVVNIEGEGELSNEDIYDYVDSVVSADVGELCYKIGYDAFNYCENLTSINIANSVAEIDSGFFDGCDNLESITVDPNNEVFDSRNNCNAIISTLDDTLLYGCKSTTIPNSVTIIGNAAFKQCSGLISINIPNSVTEIEGSAFENCYNLSSITISNGVTEIKGLAFYGCRSLTGITIPDSVTEIEEQAFAGCTIRSLTIGSGITSIGDNAFSNEVMRAIEELTIYATTPPTLGDEVFVIDENMPPYIYVPLESVDAYKAASGWSDYADYIEAIPS